MTKKGTELGDEVKRAAAAMAAGCTWRQVRTLNRMLTRIYDQAYRSHGLTAAQMSILASIALKGRIPAAAVGQALSIERSTLSRNLQRLERHGWISTERPPGTNRIVVRLTREGAATFVAASRSWERAQREAAVLLGEALASFMRLTASAIVELPDSPEV